MTKKELWDNITLIYLNKVNQIDKYKCQYKNLFIESKDDFYDCSIEGHKFRISKIYSLFGGTEVYFQSFSGDYYERQKYEYELFIEKLKPLFRDYKINYFLSSNN